MGMYNELFKNKDSTLKLICGYSLALAAMLLVVGCMAGAKAIYSPSIRFTEAGAVLVGAVGLIVSNVSMLRFSQWGRNTCVALTVAVTWVFGMYAQHRYGINKTAYLPAALFASLCLAYFLPVERRELFAQKED